MTDTVLYLLNAYAALKEGGKEEAQKMEQHRRVLADALEESGEDAANVLFIRTMQVKEYKDGSLHFWYVDWLTCVPVEHRQTHWVWIEGYCQHHLTPWRTEDEIRRFLLLIYQPNAIAPASSRCSQPDLLAQPT